MSENSARQNGLSVTYRLCFFNHREKTLDARINHFFTVLLLTGLIHSTPIFAEEDKSKSKASENSLCTAKDPRDCAAGSVMVIQGMLVGHAATYCDFTKTIVSVSDGPFICIRK